MEESIFGHCIMREDGNSGVSGTIEMKQEGDKVTIKGTITGLSEGEHGFHIHQYGNLSEGCKTAGPHYNPFNRTHGGPSDEERHVGDLGNLISKGPNVPTTFTIVDHLVKLSGPTSVLGRAFVVHKDRDDLGQGGHELSKTTGNAGARLACGTIGISGPLQI